MAELTDRRRGDLMSLLLADIPDLPAELQRLLSQIPPGSVTTYGDLARALGDVAAARWVGEYLVNHPHTEDCPCHRVVRQGGEVGLFISGDPREKAALLRTEGVPFAGDHVALREVRFAGFDSSEPLRRLREQQSLLTYEVELRGLTRTPRTVAGIDVSYVSPMQGVAAYVMLDAVTQDVLWSTTVTAPVTFPYIPNYLTFRELPLFASVFDEVRRARQEADVTLVDGNGILHPRRAGSASACGVAVETPTIGIGKKLLCGTVNLDNLPPRQPRPVTHDGEQVGVAVRSGKRNKPFFASPGQRVDMAGTIEIVLQTLGDRRLPLPIFLADRLSREEATRLKASCKD